jgi:carboxymethylenebutenolidase
MTTRVKFGKLEGEMAEPEGGGKAGGLVVIQEWHGLTDQMKGKVERLAKAGYLAIAPDLYHGNVAKNDDEAQELMGKVDWQQATSEIGAAAQYLRSNSRSNGKVGVLGFCMGGALTLAASRFIDGLACGVVFYGIPQVPIDEFAKMKTPILAHFAKKDDWASPDKAEEIRKQVLAGGGSMELFIYDAGHAFMRDGDPSRFDAEASKVAWARTVEFLKKHLG